MRIIQLLRPHLVHSLIQMFSVFKQRYTYFHIFFHPHMFSNTYFQFLSAYTKHALDLF